MPRVKSIIYIDFTTWNSIDNESVKSLVNFYMKNASCFFRGNFVDNVYSSMSGNIRDNQHSIISIENDLSDFSNPTSLEMDIVYSDSTFPSTVHNWLPDCVTNIVTKDSSVKLCKMTSSTVETFSGGIEPIDSLSVTLTPKIGDTVITNTRYIPNNIKSGIVKSNIDTSLQDFESNYQLRTSSFYIDDENGNIGQDVFYKIGICPLDHKYPYSDFSGTPIDGLTLDDIQSLLEDSSLTMNIDETYIHGYYYRLLNGAIALENGSFGNEIYGFSKSFIIPIIDENKYIIGLAYAELYKQNGELFTDDITNKNIKIYCRPSEEEEPEDIKIGGQYDLQLILTDEKINSGYIQSIYTSVDSVTDPLMFLSIQDGSTVTFNFSGNNIYQISTDGITWENYSSTRVLNNGDALYVKVSETRTESLTFSMTGKIKAYNNVISTLTPDFNFVTSLSSFMQSCFAQMFSGCASLVKAPKLPATVLKMSCYSEMFSGCTSLLEAPELPATTLASSCYYKMFYGCTSLLEAPELPATTLAGTCYYIMFSKCSSLIKAPKLPATVLKMSCYESMFSDCTSLLEAPELPATTLADYCYRDMFARCYALTKAPSILPATTLKSACYRDMFFVCSNLRNAPILPATVLTPYCYAYMFDRCPIDKITIYATDISATGCLEFWVRGVSSSGSFYCKPNVSYDSGISGIPYGWTRYDLT